MCEYLKNTLCITLNREFQLCLDVVKHDACQSQSQSQSDEQWSSVCIVTQDWDELNEFIYSNKITIKDSMKPLYFEPNGKWCCLTLPKLKLRWKNRLKQIRLGKQLYNIMSGNWKDNGSFAPELEKSNVSVLIYPLGGVMEDCRTKKVLIPFKNYEITKKQDVPEVVIGGHKMECVYPYCHYRLSFNRQGLYINRKNRSKVEELQILDDDDYIIIEPLSISISDEKGLTLSMTCH